ncbi:zinc finger protein 830 [Bradysia coprophila]|uniref:zinc finger protein 830 n=1 Tax=Bradysia coprophila TaxID=38358 RepID=UPI00187D71E0|nr:zinc finger protein 830 [Bradysia coprophila]
MSATFKLAKQKQNDLRRLMNEQKSKQQVTIPTKKIDSPLAKYNESGQLMCVLCKSIVRSEDVWKVHVNAKLHKQNIEEAKKLKDKLQVATTPAMKRPATPPVAEVPQKKLKGILKNANTTTAPSTVPTATNSIPSDFFDSKPAVQTSSYFEATLQKTSIRKDLVNFNREERNVEANGANSDVVKMETDEVLPEGFFDDPVKDAKARNLEYKDPVEEEWERFQKEIKAAASLSNAIIADDQEEATTERQIDEIDEQIRNWSRVVSLEKKKETVKEKDVNISSRAVNSSIKTNSDDDEDDDDDNFDEYIDWRAKKSYKKKNKLI